MVDVDVTAWSHARWERYCQLASATLISWEYFLQIGNEVELFWKKRWSWGKAVFLWSRYYGLCFNISNAGSDRFFRWQNIGACLQVITTHIILELRLYAMYNNNRPVVALLVFLAVAEGVVMGCLFGIPRPLVGTNNPAPGVFICADGDQPGHPWVAFYFTSTLAIETILLSLSLWKAWHSHKTGLGGGLMKVLTRDSVYYFAIIFWIYLANQIIWIVNDITLNELATGFGFSISSILANRLMISVRLTYYLQEHLPSELRSIPIGQSISNRPPSTMGIVAGPVGEYDDCAGPSHAPRGGEEFELATFNDSRGF